MLLQKVKEMNINKLDEFWLVSQVFFESELTFRFSLTVPPNIDDSLSSSDVIVREGSNVTLKCRAHGSPQPTIKWKRDDSQRININKSLSGEFICLSPLDVIETL